MLLRDFVLLGDRLLVRLGVRIGVRLLVRLTDFEDVEEVDLLEVILGNDGNVPKRVDVTKKFLVEDGLGDPVCDTLGDPVIDALDVIVKDDTVAKRPQVKSFSRFISTL
jgi:hypothetical protein